MAATVASALRWWARTKGERDAVVIGDEHLSYRQLHDWTSAAGPDAWPTTA